MFAAAFLVKMPAFPLHGWMPDGYRAMPIEVLMVFSGVLSKVGAYGFLAIVLPLFPQASVHFQTLMLLIALASILYGSMQAFTQTDARLIAGYSSIAQLGFITLGIFSLNSQGAQGALLQMVNHGARRRAAAVHRRRCSARAPAARRTSATWAGSRSARRCSRRIFLIVALATLAMPGSSNFVGEFLILLGVFKAKLAIAIIAFTGVVMASVYALRLFIRAMHNRVGETVRVARDHARATALVLVPIIAVIVFMALYPQLALHRSEESVKGRGGAGRRRPRRAARSTDARDARPDAGDATRRAAAMTPLLAATHLKGPHIDWAGLSPLIALLGGTAIVLLVGLIGTRWVRTQSSRRSPRRARRGRSG